MDGSSTPRPPRLVTKEELAIVLTTTERSIERRTLLESSDPQWIPPGFLMGENSRRWTLDELLDWAINHRKEPHLAAELARLAYSRAVDLRPESLEKSAAKRLTRQLGRKVAPDDVMIEARLELSAKLVLLAHLLCPELRSSPLPDGMDEKTARGLGVQLLREMLSADMMSKDGKSASVPVPEWVDRLLPMK